jgi:hypothetical protein
VSGIFSKIEDEKEAGYIQITIHFPEVIITNSKRLSHTIKDLFVRFNIYTCDRGKVRFSRLYGKRTTFDIKELIHGYCHSHLPKRYTYFLEDNFTQWCLGTTEIDTILSDYEFSYEVFVIISSFKMKMEKSRFASIVCALPGQTHEHGEDDTSLEDQDHEYASLSCEPKKIK